MSARRSNVLSVVMAQVSREHGYDPAQERCLLHTILLPVLDTITRPLLNGCWLHLAMLCSSRGFPCIPFRRYDNPHSVHLVGTAKSVVLSIRLRAWSKSTFCKKLLMTSFASSGAPWLWLCLAPGSSFITLVVLRSCHQSSNSYTPAGGAELCREKQNRGYQVQYLISKHSFSIDLVRTIH